MLTTGTMTPTRAEVAAELTDDGAYRRTVVLGNASEKNFKVWHVSRAAEHAVPLNPQGDLNGDLWPVILEVPQDDHRPWVVWSRFNGTDYDLAWSRWRADGGWTDISWVTLVPAMPGHDLTPNLDHSNRDGRPYVVWANESGAGSEVYLSMFLSTRWMQPYRVSDVGENAAYPKVDVLDDDTVEVTYETPAGPRTRTVRFVRPATITDDANPFEYFQMNGSGSDTMSENEAGD
jgi:hypothetical protein